MQKLKREVKNMKKRYTDYKTAVNWCHNALILLNNIPDIDTNFFEENYEIFTKGKTDEQIDNGEYNEYFQYYITDCSKFDKEWLEQTFDLTFAYSSLLDKYVLCVDHCGTSWDYVPCEVLSDSWWETNGNKYEYKN